MTLLYKVANRVRTRVSKNALSRQINEINKDKPLIKVKGSWLHFKELGFKGKITTHDVLLNNYSILRDLILKQNFIPVSDDDSFILTKGTLVLPITTAEDLFIINEVFISGIYDFQYEGPIVVFDIGMNVGFASLFFSQKPGVERVYSYEPLLPTYNQAQKVLKRNPENKVFSFPFGLGDRNGKVSVRYSPEIRGRISLEGSDNRPDMQKGSAETAEVRKASEVFQQEYEKIHQANPKTSIFMKIDTEGSEMTIICDLASAGLLSKVKGLMIEWHSSDYKEIIETLKNESFVTYTIRNNSTGMIYASR